MHTLCELDRSQSHLLLVGFLNSVLFRPFENSKHLGDSSSDDDECSLPAVTPSQSAASETHRHTDRLSTLGKKVTVNSLTTVSTIFATLLRCIEIPFANK